MSVSLSRLHPGKDRRQGGLFFPCRPHHDGRPFGHPAGGTSGRLQQAQRSRPLCVQSDRGKRQKASSLPKTNLQNRSGRSGTPRRPIPICIRPAGQTARIPGTAISARIPVWLICGALGCALRHSETLVTECGRFCARGRFRRDNSATPERPRAAHLPIRWKSSDTRGPTLQCGFCDQR